MVEGFTIRLITTCVVVTAFVPHWHYTQSLFSIQFRQLYKSRVVQISNLQFSAFDTFQSYCCGFCSTLITGIVIVVDVNSFEFMEYKAHIITLSVGLSSFLGNPPRRYFDLSSSILSLITFVSLLDNFKTFSSNCKLFLHIE